jgi:hypothetical protein
MSSPTARKKSDRPPTSCEVAASTVVLNVLGYRERGLRDRDEQVGPEDRQELASVCEEDLHVLAIRLILCALFDQRCWIGTPSSSTQKRDLPRLPQSLFEPVSKRPARLPVLCAPPDLSGVEAH